MGVANYLIFHPEKGRKNVDVNCTAIYGSVIMNDFFCRIFVDNYKSGHNEDPFVFTDPWLFSYCKMTKLRKKISKGDYLQKGSIIIFCSEQPNIKGLFNIDTIFIINNILEWKHNPLDVPNNFISHKDDNNSILWERHLKFPFQNEHKNVKYTYEAKQFNGNINECFSYMPLNVRRERVGLNFNTIQHPNIINKINEKLKFKRPVLLSRDEIENLLQIINLQTKYKIISKIIPFENNNINI